MMIEMEVFASMDYISSTGLRVITLNLSRPLRRHGTGCAVARVQDLEVEDLEISGCGAFIPLRDTLDEARRNAARA